MLLVNAAIIYSQYSGALAELDCRINISGIKEQSRRGNKY